MALTGKQLQDIQEALLAAFTSADALRMMVRIELNRNLNEIAGGDNLRIVVFNLITWAEQSGNVDELIQGANRNNPGNEALQRLVRLRDESSVPLGHANPTAAKPAAPHSAGPASIDLFLSYSRKDLTAMRTVQQSLREAGLYAWVDTSLEPGTQSWQDAIAEALREARAVVVLLSSNANQSPWVKNELGYAQTHSKPIFPVLIEGDSASSVPINLITTQWVDARGDIQHAVEQVLLPALRRQVQAPASETWTEKVTDALAVPVVPRSPRPRARGYFLGLGLLLIITFAGGLLANNIGSRFLPFGPTTAEAPTQPATLSMPSPLPPSTPTMEPVETGAESTATAFIPIAAPDVPPIEAEPQPTPTPEPSPTVTEPPPTLTPEPSPTATEPVPTPIPAPAIPGASNFMRCDGPCTPNSVPITQPAPEHSTALYLQWQYENIPVGASYTRTWSVPGKGEWIRYECVWPGPSDGIQRVKLTEPKGLYSGIWEVLVTVNGQEILRDDVEVDGSWTYWDPVVGAINSTAKCVGE